MQRWFYSFRILRKKLQSPIYRLLTPFFLNYLGILLEIIVMLETLDYRASVAVRTMIICLRFPYLFVKWRLRASARLNVSQTPPPIQSSFCSVQGIMSRRSSSSIDILGKSRGCQPRHGRCVLRCPAEVRHATIELVVRADQTGKISRSVVCGIIERLVDFVDVSMRAGGKLWMRM